MLNIIDKISSAHPNRRKIIFIHGKAFSGKLTLAKIITQNLNTKEIDCRGGLRSEFFLGKFNFDSLDYLILNDVNEKLDDIEKANFLQLVSSEYIIVNKQNEDPYRVIVQNVIVISKKSFKKFRKNYNVDINRLFTDVIKIDSQQDFFQFLARKKITIKEVLSPFKNS